MKIIGIDDAGRGPVIGPMILAGVIAETEDNEKFLKMGAKDSKLLSPKRRSEIARNIMKNYKYHIETTSPSEIDSSVNLNYTEAIKAAMIINKLTEDLNEPVEVVLDCPSVNLVAWNGDVLKLIKRPEIVKMRCEHKADFNHPIVSAASIIAKEEREKEIGKIKKELVVDFGSGYSSDPRTREFVRDYFKDPRFKEIIRFSWDTIKKIEREKLQKKLF
jgi:ribonuclease HII